MVSQVPSRPATQSAHPRFSWSSWGRYARRVALALLMVLVVSTITFFAIRLMPGSPVQVELSTLIQQGVPLQQAYQQIRVLYNIDLRTPLILQYLQYLNQLAHFQFGTSYQYTGTPVTVIVAKSLPWTLFTVLSALVVSAVLGITLGVLLATVKNRTVNQALSLLGALVNGVPNYIYAILLLYVFADRLQLFPTTGPFGAGVTPGFNLPYLLSVLRHAVLPISSYVIATFTGWMLLMRSSVVSVQGEDFLLAAHAWGLKPRIVAAQYTGRNAVLPLFTIFLLAIGGSLGGSIFIEQDFSYPGIGFYLNQAVAQRDYPVMQACFLLITFATIMANLLADLLYAWIDPRIRE